MIAFFRKLRKDRRGNVLAITAAFLPVIVGAAGLATDTIQWTLWRRQLQRAADSAAFAGVYDRAANAGATTTTSAAVCRDLAVNLHTWMSLLATSPCTGSAGSYAELDTTDPGGAIITNRVMVRLQVQKPLPFSSMFMSAAPIIQASATAASIRAGGNPCMLALSTSGTAIDNSGNAKVTAPTCIFYSDSASSNSAAAGGNSKVKAKAIAGVGGIASSNNWQVDQYLPYSPPLPDPLAPPSSTAVTPDVNDMKCAGHYVTGNGNGNGNGNGGNGGGAPVWVYDDLTAGTDMATATYLGSDGQPHTGANCWKSVSIGSSASFTVPASYSGPIYVNGGNVNFQGDFTCSACAIVMTNKDPTSTTIGTYDTNSQAKVNITAPTSGTYDGIAIYQDRRAPGGNVDKINGGANNQINGIVYFPKDTLWLNGTGDTVSLCSMFIANKLNFNGTGNIAISSPEDTVCSGVHTQKGTTTTIVRLIA